MQKIKVSEIADEAGIGNKEVIEKAKELGFELKAANSTLDEKDAESLMEYILTGSSPLLKQEKEVKKETVSKDAGKKKETENTKKVVESENKENTTKVKQKEQTKVVQENTESQSKQNESKNDETLSSVGIKRTGLRVVKKAQREEPIQKEVEEVKPKNSEKSLKELFSDTEKKVASVKPKVKVKKKAPPPPSEHGIKLDIDTNIAELTLEDEESEYMLDLHEDVLSERKEQEKTKAEARTPSRNLYAQKPTIRRNKPKKRRPKEKVDNSIVDEIEIPREIRVYEFADVCKKTPAAVISVLFSLGKMVTKNDFLEEDEIEIVADEFEISVKYKDHDDVLDYVEEIKEEDIGDDVRAPIVTIMGHVDHGKTSLLDYIKNTKVVHGEAGGITQHIGAYQVTKDGKDITFIDTPGHEAFTAMRSRGSSITDVVIIVVAADDGVKPQTVEAISHAKASGAPIIVAVNKIDKPAANVDMVKTQMADHDILATDWGGNYDFVNVSAHTGEGIDDLLETILLQTEILELKGDKSAKAKAMVVESSLEKGKGPVATVIVQNGTLRVGDSIVADTTFGKVRALINDLGENVKELTLSQPGQVLGLADVPSAGAVLVSMENEKDARDIAQKRAEAARVKELSKSTKVSLEELSAMVAEGKIKALPVIIKADVQGSLEAIKGSLEKLKNDEVKINIIHAGVGGITESDVALASASENTVILGFNVRPTGLVKTKAKKDGVEIRTYNIIYALLDDVRDLLTGMMSPVYEEENTGQAEVREVFKIGGVGSIAGCFVSDGQVIRGGKARVIRNGIVIHDNSNITSLKRFKDEVRDVGKGYECGIMLEDYNDIKVGDVIETFKEVAQKVTL